MKQVLLYILFFAFCLPVLAQQNFQPGYIIQKGDTVRGLLDQRGDKRNAAKVGFRRSSEAPEETLQPQDIEGYGFWGGARYEVKTVSIGNTEQLYFLTLLVKGKASLYSLRDADAQDHFYLEQANSMQELIFKEETKLIEGKRLSVPYHFYRGVLFKAFAGCPEQLKEIHELPFTAKALIDITARYNQCLQPASLSYVESPRKTTFLWGPTLGASTTLLHVQGGNLLLKKDQEFKSSVGLTAGVFLNTTFPWINQKLSLHTELLYSQISFSKTVVEERPPAQEHHQIDIDLHYLQLPFLLRYTFPKGSVRPFVNAGMINSYAIAYKQEITTNRISHSQTDSYITNKPYVADFRKYEQSYALGAGVVLPDWLKRRVSFEARYEKGNGFSEYMGLSTQTDKITVLLSFCL